MRPALLTATLLLAAPAAADPCRPLSFAGTPYTICEARAGRDELRLWLAPEDGAEAFGHFRQLEAHLAARGQRLGFAMNAGMYHPDRRPVGLYIEDGLQRSRLVTAAGPGNFGMLPNGVFCIREDSFAVIESRRLAGAEDQCRHATQSGPMLLIEGAVHPRFIPGSDARVRRNGVGVSPDGSTAWFAISEAPVNFDDFARMFRDALGVRDALYLDGNVSRLHAPAQQRSDGGRRMGPIVGVVVEGE